MKSPTSADGLWVHDGKEWRTRYAMWRGKPLKTKEDWDNYYLAINPPVTEPTGCGAVVEAFAKTKKVETHSRFTHIGEGLWVEEGTPQKRYYFDDLTNPTIISEGVER